MSSWVSLERHQGEIVFTRWPCYAFDLDGKMGGQLWSLEPVVFLRFVEEGPEGARRNAAAPRLVFLSRFGIVRLYASDVEVGEKEGSG